MQRMHPTREHPPTLDRIPGSTNTKLYVDEGEAATTDEVAVQRGRKKTKEKVKQTKGNAQHTAQLDPEASECRAHKYHMPTHERHATNLSRPTCVQRMRQRLFPPPTCPFSSWHAQAPHSPPAVQRWMYGDLGSGPPATGRRDRTSQRGARLCRGARRWSEPTGTRNAHRDAHARVV